MLKRDVQNTTHFFSTKIEIMSNRVKELTLKKDTLFEAGACCILLERIRKLQILLSKLKLTDTKPSFQDENDSESDEYDRQ